MPTDAPAPLVTEKSTIRRAGSRYASSPSWKPAAYNEDRSTRSKGNMPMATHEEHTDLTVSSHTQLRLPNEVVCLSAEVGEGSHHVEEARHEFQQMHAISGLTMGTMPSKPQIVHYANTKAVSGLTTKPSQPNVLKEPQQEFADEEERVEIGDKEFVFLFSGNEYLCCGLALVLLLAVILLPVVICGILGMCSDGGSPGAVQSITATKQGLSPGVSAMVQISLRDDTLLEIPTYTFPSLIDSVSPPAKARLWLEDNYSSDKLKAMEPWRLQQLFALAILFFSLDKRQWAAANQQQWLDTSISECDWSTDIVCYETGSEFEGRVREINLNDFQKSLDGSLPPELELLQCLEGLVINGSGLSGALDEQLPIQWSHIPTLRRLSFSDNRLMGPIPPILGFFTQLTFLSLHRNLFSGAIPTELGLLTNLEQLLLDDNQLSGRVPDSICAIDRLSSIRVDCLEEVSCPSNCNCDCS